MTLDSVIADIVKIGTFLKPHWPFWTYMAIFAFIGEVSKTRIYTPANRQAAERTINRLWNAGGASRIPATLLLVLVRTPFEYHPVVAGIALGLIPGVPVSKGVNYGMQSVLYCMGAGILSLAFYDLVHGIFKFVWKDVLRKSDPPPAFELPGEDNDGQP